jgi:hypothetical protein
MLHKNNCERSEEDHQEKNSIKQEQCDGKISYRFLDETDLRATKCDVR